MRLGVVLWVSVLSACGPSQAVSSGDSSTDDAFGLNGVRLRLVAGNLSSGNAQSWDLPGIRLLQGVKPDIALVQEFNYRTNSSADFQAFADQLGAGFTWVRGAPAQIPNGIVSRYPVLESGDWADPRISNRAFTWARIDIPGPVDLYAVSVHLSTTSSNRPVEAQALVNALTAKVPAGAYVAIGGDLNTGSRAEAAVGTLGTITTTSGPYPVDRNNNGNTNASRGKPYDWVLVSPNLNQRATPVTVGASSFANGLVADSRVYSPIAELSPALASDSAALNMQHMPVVRDFDLQATAPGTVHVDAPNGGERFTVGSSQLIRWTATNTTAVNVDYSADGATFTRVASDVAAAAGGVGWTVPGPATVAAVVRVTSTSSAAVSDDSDAPFEVALPTSVRVVAPNGGERFEVGSAQLIQWTASNVATVNVDYAADGVTFTRVATGLSAVLGSVGWTVPSPATAAAVVRVTSATDGTVTDASDAAFEVTQPATPGRVFINEILANEPGSATSGEFVELFNGGGTAVDLSGWTLSDGVLVRHRFAAGTALAPGATLVVFGGAAGIPPGLSNAVAASTSALGLGNAGDTVTLADGGGVTVDGFTYPSSLASQDGVSMNRAPDRSPGAAFVLHTTLSPRSSSPGVAVSGSP